MKKFTVNCDFEGQTAPFDIFVGSPKEGNHALTHQAKWLAEDKGGAVAPEVMEAISKLQELSSKHKVPLDELCVYALGSVDEDDEGNDDEEEERDA